MHKVSFLNRKERIKEEILDHQEERQNEFSKLGLIVEVKK
jgi:hypothetical protein